MKHISVPIEHSIELINVEAVSPLISKCQIKVCYVGNEPNRNQTVITKDLAIKMAESLPGSPIVGYYNKNAQDFEEHNKVIQIENGELAIIDITRPYGFVDINPKIWFQKFKDDNEVIREYLVTEGWIWTEAYPESKRIFEKDGNNQSLELHKKSIKGHWAENINQNNRFFIFNEAIIEKLCILGEDYEPCFEGSQIKAEFSLEDDFKQLKINMYSMMTELNEALKKGGSTTFMNQELNNPSVEVPVSETNPTEEFVKKDEEKEKELESNKENNENNESEEDKEKEKDEFKKDKKCNYSLEDIPEYTSLKENYDELILKYSTLETENQNLKDEIQPLRNFKLEVEKKQKEEMINSFYMLSDEDKKDVIQNIDTYSLEDIEAKLSVICFRNKINFNLDNEEEKPSEEQMLFNLNDSVQDSTPEWIKAIKQVASEM